MMQCLLGSLLVALTASQLPPREPISALGVQGPYVTVNGRPSFLVGQMGSEFASGRTLDDIARILDVMMVPYGMNFCATADFGTIYWGAWNTLVNVRNGDEREFRPHPYPWKRTGGGETTFGGPRFDLDQFDQAYFDSLRGQLQLYMERGIVPVVSIFSEHAINMPLHWKGHPFHPVNNVNHLGLPERDAIPEYFENRRALAYQEAYVRKLVDTLKDGHYILSPFGEMRAAPRSYVERWLRLFEEYKRKDPGRFLLCISGTRELLDLYARDPAVDLIDVYCYHADYDLPEVNVPDGPKGIRQTIKEAREKYRKPVGKLYFKYGYPYADRRSPWADPETGTQDGGPPTAARDAMHAVYDSGGFAIFFKMAWARDRGAYLKPDSWSEDIREFMKATGGQPPPTAPARPAATRAGRGE